MGNNAIGIKHAMWASSHHIQGNQHTHTKKWERRKPYRKHSLLTQPNAPEHNHWKRFLFKLNDTTAAVAATTVVVAIAIAVAAFDEKPLENRSNTHLMEMNVANVSQNKIDDNNETDCPMIIVFECELLERFSLEITAIIIIKFIWGKFP